MADVNLALEFRIDVVERTSHRVRTFGFGDGYEAMSADGVNSRMTEYAVTTEPLRSGVASFQNKLDKVATGDYFLTSAAGNFLAPYVSEARRYRLKGNTYDKKFMPASGAVVFTFTLVEAYANA